MSAVALVFSLARRKSAFLHQSFLHVEVCTHGLQYMCIVVQKTTLKVHIGTHALLVAHKGCACLKYRQAEPALFAVSRPLHLPTAQRFAHFSSSQIWLATLYLALYGVYVTIVFRGPKGGKGANLSSSSSQDGLEVGGLGSGLDDHAVDARWM